MSPDLERRLREGRAALPEPDAAVTERARQRALEALRRRHPRARAAALTVVALIAAVALGAGVGTFLPSSGTAAPRVIGTGLLPQPGWTVLQTGANATENRQSLSIATNVALDPEDAARGIRGSSGLPYETLLRLPARGVVIVALFTLASSEPWADNEYPTRPLPLRVEEAVRHISFSTQVRPARPLGQYELRARVEQHHVVIQVYFGMFRPSSQLITVAQRQLDRLIVAAETASFTPRPALAPAAAASDLQAGASRIVDRTFVCKPMMYGGVGDVDVRATPPETDPVGFSMSAHLVVRTGTTLPTGDLVFVRAQAQERIGRTSPFPGPAGVYAHVKRCSPSRARADLTAAGLVGPPVRFASDLTCSVRGRVVVRVRARLAAAADWRRAYEPFLIGARGRVEEASLAVRGASSGAPLAYMTVDRSGGTRLWSSSRCR